MEYNSKKVKKIKLILPHNNIFKDEDCNTEFLPNIEFKNIWKQELSDNTRTVLWKYLRKRSIAEYFQYHERNYFGKKNSSVFVISPISEFIYLMSFACLK